MIIILIQIDCWVLARHAKKGELQNKKDRY